MGYINSGTTKWLYNDGSNNGIKIENDGSLRKYGTAQVFDDLVGDIFSKKLYNTAYTVDYDWNENAIKFQANGDITDKNKRVQWNVQLPHNATIGTASFFKMHFHWWQDSTTDYTVTLRYRIQNNNQEKETSWTTLTASTSSDSIYTYTGGTLNQLTTFSEIDITGCNISSTLQFQMTRTDGNSGDLLMTFIDAHIGIDSDGSRSEWAK